VPSKVTSTSPTPFSQEDVDSLQMLRASPIMYLRTVLVQFIQGLFWYMPVDHYHWEPNINESRIVITDESPIKVKEYGGRPCISVTRAPVTFASIGLDDMVQYDQQTNTKKKSVLLPGNMSINCCSREPLESEWLAFFVAEQLWLLRDHLQRKSIYQIGQNIGGGAPSPAGSIVVADQGDEWTCTTAALPFQIVRTGAVTPLGQKIAHAVQTTLQQRGTPAPVLPTTVPAVFHPAGAGGTRGSLKQPGVEVEQKIQKALQPPQLRGRPIPLAGSGMGES